ncbi:hypothetical protein [Chryseobacterium profundimaris]|uniref:Uncharacterized protein n=1 Tax=Chryseobacterium profundimaris TaxID=1387275 RepID=A0ABY1P3N0_9FLAO|nr:hypothetical protein [Chryseobacterium profundimaris]SMP23940.1 hypothetical protein SAMN06264346_107185 [Chryseobacterium profundimaris]
MKHLRLLIFLCILFSSKNYSQKFNLKENKIEINLNGILRPASTISMLISTKFNDNFYSIFEERQMNYFEQTQKYLIVYNILGKILNAEKLPKELHNSFYLDLYEYEEKIYLIDQFNTRYVLDFKTYKFDKSVKGNDIVYEDQNYQVMYKDFGEWGQATWFINKKDKKQYFTSINGTNTNFADGKFYLTSFNSIAEISDPKNLTMCSSEQNYYYVNKHDKIFDSYDYFKGVSFIYKDSISDDPYHSEKAYANLKYRFLSSFPADHQLYHITQLKDKTAITKINKDQVDIVYKFNEKYDIFKWYNQYRTSKSNYRFLRFKNGYNSDGFIEVDNKNIDITKVHYIYDTLQYVKSDSITKLISNLYERKKILKKDVTTFEESTKGTDILFYRNNINHNGYYPAKYKNININTINYIKRENEFLTQNIEYLFTTDDQLKAIFIEWDKTKFFNNSEKKYFPIKNENSIESDKYFKKKYKEIRQALIEKGEKADVKIPSDKLDFESWILNGWQFNLYKVSNKNINGITLYICKQEDFNGNE